MSNRVSILSCPDYAQEKVDAAIRQSIENIGGIKSFVSAGQRVLLKPNLLTIASPEEAITTHPAVVSAMVKLVQEAGGEPIIADSPGTVAPYSKRGLKSLYESTGMADVARRTGAALNWDTEIVEVSNPDGVVVKRLEIIKPVLDADVIINLPKLKTHILTTFTGAVKNLFGVIPGYNKGAYHVKFQKLELFSEMLLDVLGFVKPGLSVMDGIIGIEGDGPGKHGNPRSVGVLIASQDCVAIDVTACRIVGIARSSVPVLIAAIKRGWWNGELDQCEGLEEFDFIGNSIEEVKIDDFKKPSTIVDPENLIKRKWLQSILFSLIKSAFAYRPIPRKGDCLACGACIKACPQSAITIVKKLAVVEHDKCIRCYCCHELCPEAAIDLKLSWLGWLVQKSKIAGKRAPAT